MREFLDSTEALGDGGELRRRVGRDGYLFLRGLLPRDALASLRLRLLEIARESGWLLDGAPTAEGVTDPRAFCAEPEPEFRRVYQRMYCLEALHALPHHPNLLGLFERMLGGDVLLHPRIALRPVFPRGGRVEDYSTRPHQDFPKVQGTAETYTVWIPLSDCPREMGPLAVAERSHLGGVYDTRPAPGYGGAEVAADFDGAWVGGDFGLGDVSVHHSLTVHKALPNMTNRLRLSVDCRYQRACDPVNERCLELDGRPLTWERVYAGWRSRELQYYWRKWELKTEPLDPSYNRRRDALAFEAAAAGNRSAVSTLRRIVANDPDPAKRRRARQLLDDLNAG